MVLVAPKRPKLRQRSLTDPQNPSFSRPYLALTANSQSRTQGCIYSHLKFGSPLPLRVNEQCMTLFQIYAQDVTCGFGVLESDPNISYLVLEFLELQTPSFFTPRLFSPSRPVSHSPRSLRFAKLHTTAAPIPRRYSTPQFGFPFTTCCGDTPQDNTYLQIVLERIFRGKPVAIHTQTR